jgi:hypothetical protein
MGGRVLQGRFMAGGPRLPVPGRNAGVAQPRGSHQGGNQAEQLPAGLLKSGNGGNPLPETVRTKMESFFGTDFSDVRVHVGPEAPSIGALAFTIGSSLYFAPGQYNPDSPQGQALLGHELTHVVQQRAGRVRNPFGSGIAVVQDQHLEAEADRLGQRAAGHRPASVQAKPAPGPAIRQATRQTGHSTGHSTSRSSGQPAQAKSGSSMPKGTPPGNRPSDVTKPATAQKRSGRDGDGYRLIVGGYLHQDGSLPDGMAGHGFVAVQKPGGRREAFGFSPANFSRMDPKRDLGRLTAGVPGKVHRDETAFSKPGVRTRSFAISREQADQAMSKVSEYKTAQFSLARKQCSSFAMDVARAAGVDDFGDNRVANPREWYRKI